MVTWYVYLLRCGDGSLYTGVTTDLLRRVGEHNGAGCGRRGARYTRAHLPVALVYSEAAADRATACVREREIKKLSKAAKERLIGSPKAGQ